MWLNSIINIIYYWRLLRASCSMCIIVSSAWLITSTGIASPCTASTILTTTSSYQLFRCFSVSAFSFPFQFSVFTCPSTLGGYFVQLTGDTHLSIIQSLEVVHISEVENVLVLWWSQSGAHGSSIIVCLSESLLSEVSLYLVMLLDV